MTLKTLTFHRPGDGAAAQFSSAPPLSLYVHLPWCVRKCPYCDFNSHVAAGPVPENDYVDALLRDLEAGLCSACSSGAARRACSNRGP